MNMETKPAQIGTKTVAQLMRESLALLHDWQDRPGYGLRGLVGEEAWARVQEPARPPTWRERIAAAWRCLRGDMPDGF